MKQRLTEPANPPLRGGRSLSPQAPAPAAHLPPITDDQIPHRRKAQGGLVSAANRSSAATAGFVIEIQHAPWAPIYVKQLVQSGAFTVTTDPREAMEFTAQDALALARVAAEVARWTARPGPVRYVPEGI